MSFTYRCISSDEADSEEKTFYMRLNGAQSMNFDTACVRNAGWKHSLDTRNSSPDNQSSSPIARSSSPSKVLSSSQHTAVGLNRGDEIHLCYNTSELCISSSISGHSPDSPNSDLSERTSLFANTEHEHGSCTSETSQIHSSTGSYSPGLGTETLTNSENPHQFAEQLCQRLLAVLKEQEEKITLRNRSKLHDSMKDEGFSLEYSESATTSLGSPQRHKFASPRILSSSDNSTLCDKDLFTTFAENTGDVSDELDQTSCSTDLGTIVFASPPESCVHSPRSLKRRRLPRIDPSQAKTIYRIRSLAPTGSGNIQASVIGQTIAQDISPTSEPPLKRCRTNYHSSEPRQSRHFATQPASLRKAASLKSDIRTDAPLSAWIPTVPSTPEYSMPPSRGQHLSDAFQNNKELHFVAPIIAPPPDHVPSLPLTPETSAKIRLARYLSREFRIRDLEGLASTCVLDRLGHHEEMLKAQGIHAGPLLTWELALGLRASLREKIIHWILTATPANSPYEQISSREWTKPLTSSCSTSSIASDIARSSSNSSVTTTTSEITSSRIPDLFDQLSTSPETRFHAAYMFLRYFYITMGDSRFPLEKEVLLDFAKASIQSHTRSLIEEGEELVIWDIAVACLALSVKYHRDYLEPNLPIYARHFRELAPHALTSEDLETSQRDILEVFSYVLGDTPQKVIDELWNALPSLRQLLSFEGGWNNVKKLTWQKLFDSLLKPDVLRFSLSLLTAAAVIESIICCSVCRYEYEAEWNIEACRRGRGEELAKERVELAEAEAEGVLRDFEVVLGTTQVAVEECRRWLKT